ncbi:polysaccharide deacetylase [Microtetraspora sp. NBRC 13810]|uniref:polysaccharide deacetylase family protein n=1 Tax=Microtetraspora sp. NBRC 13810 TaxID=3030990 RepID=UPI0024A1844D|nr:polysaccharide deacetylase family protein [Microtetraspora sp. NBRC 13810]GLW12355.1 polysaccharide deacetylase [Microtetraspora sp. NBRC 13810]
MTRVPILMYHSVSERPNDETRPLAVRPSDFADQLGYLRDHGFTPITFGALVTALHEDDGRDLPARPVVLTFDDGYADFHTEALPLLEKAGAPATVFLTTGWLADAGQDAAGRPLDTMLTWSQAAEAASCGVELGGHSHSHPQLDQLSDADLREELRRNKALIEDRLGLPVPTMAYPYGYSSARVRREVARAGYTAACAVANDVASGRDDVFTIPRLTIAKGTTLSTFGRAVHDRAIPLIYLKERLLTKGFAVVRRTRYGLRRVRGHV